ncbi:MAG: response regulator [Bacteroidota bacterium]
MVQKVRKVLVVEDDLAIRESIIDILKLEKIETVEAQNGREALDILIDQDLDLVISDVMMPEMDGYELLDSYRKTSAKPTVPFVFLTALSERENLRKGMQLGADDYLIKPFTQKELLETIHTQYEKYTWRKLLVEEQYRAMVNGTIEEIAKENLILKQEVRHSLKDNLRLILSFFDLGKSTGGESNNAAIKDRIQALGIIHKEAFASDMLSKVNMRKLLYGILGLSYPGVDPSRYSIQSFRMSLKQAIPFGLFVHEMGAILKKGNGGHLYDSTIISSELHQKNVEFSISIPRQHDHYPSAESPETESVLLNAYLDQLGTSLTVQEVGEQVRYSIHFPLDF